ncbi:MAG: hypothetical protein IT422_28890 [Pirellulaceae bacterium]|nr:hypothetical protein [Pirellulaceae bacterium]
MKSIRWLWFSSLLVFMAYCLWGLIRDGSELRHLKVDAARLERLVGRIDTNDEQKIQVINVRNDGSNELLWRVYLPAGHAWNFSHGLARHYDSTNSISTTKEPQEILIRIRLVNRDGRWVLMVMSPNSWGISNLPDGVGGFLSEHWNEFDTMVAAQDGNKSFSTDEVVSLLSVEVPEALMETAKGELEDSFYKQLQTQLLFSAEVGTVGAFVARAERLEMGSH